MWFGWNVFFAWPISITTYRILLGTKITIKSIFDQCGRFACPTCRGFFIRVVQFQSRCFFMYTIRARLINVCTYVSIDTIQHFIRFVFGFSISHSFCVKFFPCCVFFSQFIQSAEHLIFNQWRIFNELKACESSQALKEWLKMFALIIDNMKCYRIFAGNPPFSSSFLSCSLLSPVKMYAQFFSCSSLFDLHKKDTQRKHG